ncbi:MucBP domain-containing protein [Peptoniphilus sp. KCTC 25270]|uniref:MucBP domain-containing protein n=1 Tax=Peptoniphilus sp. KCTC 25270 TaxID=2897414 RepID=UPI001E436BD8|nr:MucBP domain-containing protein [Peptoniphilus sp. KCTC 25270]MCD1147269.1 MucBP domain-containing protein [Peptoniphilus sp. KCTC 25270]
MKRTDGNKGAKYGMRKLKVGFVPVLLAFSIVMGPTVLALPMGESQRVYAAESIVDKTKGVVLVHYVDTMENTIAPSVVDSIGDLNSSYNTTDNGMKPEKITYKEKEYTLLKDKVEGEEKGTIKTAITNITYVYKTEETITKYVDIEGKEIKEAEIGEKPKVEIKDYTFLDTKTDAYKNRTHIYVKTESIPDQPVQEIQTDYVDESGKEIIKSKVGVQPRLEIPQYIWVKTEIDGNHIQHVYKSVTEEKAFVTKYVDETGKSIAGDEKGIAPQKEISDYEFVKTEIGKEGNVLHIYKSTRAPIEKVVTNFRDEKGVSLEPTVAGKQEKKVISGYEFVETKVDENGNVTHIYREVKDPTKPETPENVVTKYVDKDGQEVAKEQEGKMPKKDVAGYKFLESKTDKEGNILHVYEKLPPATPVETYYVDKEGKFIIPKEEGAKDKRDLNGYKFIATKKDDKGNITHIYEKITTSSTSKPTNTTSTPTSTTTTTTNTTKSSNPQTFVSGYGMHALGILGASALALFAEKQRRKK